MSADVGGKPRSGVRVERYEVEVRVVKAVMAGPVHVVKERLPGASGVLPVRAVLASDPLARADGVVERDAGGLSDLLVEAKPRLPRSSSAPTRLRYELTGADHEGGP